jgi:sarcosine oxidase
MATSDFDVIVVGGGVMGLAAAYYTAAAGKSALLLEQYKLFNDQASSKGESRFFRVVYADPYLARFALAADPFWVKLEQASGRTLRNMIGVLFLGEPGQSTPEGNLQGCIDVMNQLGIPYTEYRDAAAIERAYPIWKGLTAQTLALYQAQGGPIYAQRTLQALADLARQHGAVLHDAEPVVRIDPGPSDDGPVTIETAKDRYRASRAILAPNAWANGLLASLGIRLNITLWEMTLAYYAVSGPGIPVPLWFYFGQPKSKQENSTYYGFPPVEIQGQVKMSTDFTFKQCWVPDACSHAPDQAILGRIDAFITEHLNGIRPGAVADSPTTCLYAVTPDWYFVLDFLPGHRNVVLFTGDSGQAFKFAPLIGSILCDLAVRGTTSYDITPFSISRPGILIPPGANRRGATAGP